MSAAGEPAPENLRHYAVADRIEMLPTSVSESLVSPPAARWARPAPQADSPVAAGPRDLGVPVLDPIVRVPVPPCFLCWTGELSCAATELFPCQDLARG